jgi:hypothetical protein
MNSVYRRGRDREEAFRRDAMRNGMHIVGQRLMQLWCRNEGLCVDWGDFLFEPGWEDMLYRGSCAGFTGDGKSQTLPSPGGIV